MNGEKFFLWGSRTFEAAKFGFIKRFGSRIFARYGKRIGCVAHCQTKEDAELALELLGEKIGGLDERGRL